MRSMHEYMTATELSLILNVSEVTVKMLVKTGQLPCLRVKNRVLFDFKEVVKHFRQLEGDTSC